MAAKPGPGAEARKKRHRTESYDRGVKAERWAGWLMRAKGFDIVARRYKGQGGEIDLICRKQDLLVFLEVKYRGSLDEALHVITPRNQARIIAAAGQYLAEHPDETAQGFRFDVLAFAKGRRAAPLWEHVEAAFEAF